MEKNVYGSTALKNKKLFIKCAQKEDAHIQYVTNHYAKFEYTGMKTFGATDYTN